MKRGKFALGYRHLLSCDAGELIPVGLTEVLPGDTIQMSSSVLLRASPLLAPVMHPVTVSLSHWFVPHRLSWEDWEDFITGGPDGMDASVFPTINFPTGGPEIGTLADYLGIPTDVVRVGGTDVSALPFRGYARIWNEFFRDQDLQTALTIDETSGADTTTSVALQNCAWEKDYFTSSRPWEQKGPSITIPIGDRADVKGLGTTGDITTSSQAVRETDGTNPTYAAGFNIGVGSGAVGLWADTDGAAGAERPEIYADLSSASAITINLLREALALQRYEEARARFGSRYVEYLRYLGVQSSDARLQRPEYLGGGRQVIQFSEVLQTAEGSDPVGELRGHGIAAARSNRFRRFIEEHGYIFTLMSIRPKTVYMQGLGRTWNRRTKEDFWQKELQHIGQQAVLNKEIYAAHATPEGTFGYQDRYDEYRRSESRVSGEFKSSTLNFWHFAREFSSDPALNAAFVSCVPTERTFAVPSQDVYYANVKHSIQARRLVSSQGSSFTF